MRIAYYAPLKPPDHPVPSGDRLMARAFKALLEGLGHAVEVASTLRAFDRDGDQAHQLALKDRANAERRRLLQAFTDGPAPDLWFTYHAYHKAPDWLGPAASEALGIPYVIAEASIAGKQAGGAWDQGHRATIEAVNGADAVLALTAVDARNLARHMSDPTRLVHFPPFLLAPSIAPGERAGARRHLATALDLPAEPVWLVTVAMMRPDIKCQSYRLLARSLERLTTTDWRLLVIGDGEAGPEIRQLLQSAAGERVRFLGERPPAEIAGLCGAGDLFVWPALEEAYGMAILEALAAGLPVIACAEGGVRDLVEHEVNGLLARARSAEALAGLVDQLIGDAERRRRMGEAARARVAERHGRAAAEALMRRVLACLTDGSGGPSCG